MFIPARYYLLLLFTAQPLHAAGPLGFGPDQPEGPLQTDRPDFTEGTATVTPGHLQFELGYRFTYDEEGGSATRQHVPIEGLLRAGLLDSTELRLGWPPYLWQETSGDGVEDQAEGVGNLTIGAKQKLLQAREARPALSFIVEASLPTGADSVNEEKFIPAAKLLWSHNLSDYFGAAGNFNFSVPEDAECDRFLEPAASLALAWALSERLGMFYEYFGFYPPSSAAGVASRHYLSTGLTFAVNADNQFDTYIIAGLNDDAEDLQIGAGYSFRY